MTENNRWQDLADKYNKMISGDDTQQVVYKSDETDNCKPTIVEKMQGNKYPYVVEAPTGMVDPKYVWSPLNPHWVDLAIVSQAEEISALKKQLATQNTATEEVKRAQAQLLLMLGAVVPQADNNGEETK